MSENEYTHASRLNLCGEHVRRVRQERGLTLAQVQTLLSSEYGLDTDLNGLEQRRCEVTDVELATLAKLLEVSPEQLVFGRAFPDKDQLRELLRTIKKGC